MGAGVSKVMDNQAFDFSPTWAPLKRGLDKTEASISISDASDFEALSMAEVVTATRSAVVRVQGTFGEGSGFLVTPNGLIMTNNHVIFDAQEITVHLDDGTGHTAEVVMRDMIRDLALLKIEGTGLPFLELGEAGRVALGEQVAILGYPLGQEDLSVTSGIVSSLIHDAGREMDWITTDADVNFGNSGGPLLSLQGQVVGIVTQIRGEGIVEAITVNSARLSLLELVNQALTELGAGEAEKAVELLTYAIELDPSLVVAYEARARAYRELDDAESALADHTAAINLRPSDSRRYVFRGSSRWRLGDAATSLEDFDRAIQLNPAGVSSHNYRSLVHTTLGNFERAIADANRALELRPTDNDFIVDTRGYAYLKAGEYEKAKADYDEVFERGYNHAASLLGGGLTYAALGETERAIQLLDLGLETAAGVEKPDPQLADLIAMAEEWLAALG